MYLIKKISQDLVWVGANDRRLSLFEGVYSVPEGVSYNAYLLDDEKTVLFDTADRAVKHKFIENLQEALAGRNLDYLVIQHLEPDHSAAIPDLLARYPHMKMVCTAKALALIKQFYHMDVAENTLIVKENDTLVTGRHTLRFIMAPMVHWPEVMVTFDETDGVLFSADAFGSFGALNGGLFADEVDFERDYLPEVRRYYTNIVGKYGIQTAALLHKAASLKINMICPLHGYVWRKNLQDILLKYDLWSRYEPESAGVMIVYGSIYGNTENAAEILSARLRDLNVKTVMVDVSAASASQIIAEAFRWSHLIFASATTNMRIFPAMEALVHDLAAHNLQNRTIGIIQNGSWAPASGGLIREKLSACKHITWIENTLNLQSALSEDQLPQIEAMALEIARGISPAPPVCNASAAGLVEPQALFKLSYGLYIVTAHDGGKDNGCVTNTAIQVTDNPITISLTMRKGSLTYDMMMRTGLFNVSVLTQDAPFSIFQRFGYQSGRNIDKFAEQQPEARAENGVVYLQEHVSGVIAAKVLQTVDCQTHTVFIACVTQAFALSDTPSVTYQYYQDHIKPKVKPATDTAVKRFACKICGHIYEGNTLPDDFICPICKHGASFFEAV